MPKSASFLPTLILALFGISAIACRGGMPLTLSLVPDGDKPYVQVSSVSAEPSKIHRIDKPGETILTVQIILHGRIPAGSTARVGVGTYSSEPPGNNVIYDPVQTIPLKESPEVVKFKARVGPQTTRGKLIVAASLNGATNGVEVRLPETPDDWHTELMIVDP